MVTKPSTEESQQLLQTVEMFEAITAIQPNDYQSLEILKEAYSKLGRVDEARRAALRLANAYASLGQVSEALQEYESLLQQFPGDDEAIAALAALQASHEQLSTLNTGGVSPAVETSKQEPPTAAPPVTNGAGTPLTGSPAPSTPRKGDSALADVLIAEKLVTPQAIQPLLDQLEADRPALIAKGEAPNLIQLLVDQQLAKLDDLLLTLVSKSGKPYLPLSYYDVDRDSGFLIPQETGFAHCLVPFDLISRSVLIATANPFDVQVRDAVEGMLEYRVFWYISPPAEITAALRRLHGLETKGPKGG